MRCFRSIDMRVHAVLALACLAVVLLPATAAEPAAEPEYKVRDLVTQWFADGDGEDLAKVVGWEKPLKKVVALEYKVLVFEDGKEKAVDPKTHIFKLGDRIRVTVEPFSDSYIYIFHIGASGAEVFLLPPEDQEPPLIEAEQMVTLPEEGYFRVIEPTGHEKLLVVATENPIEDRDALAGVLTKTPDQYTPEEVRISEQLHATVEANLLTVQEDEQAQRDKIVKFRGLLEDSDELADKVRTRGVQQATVEVPSRDGSGGTVAMYLSVADDGAKIRSDLLVTIPLTSRR